ncbi:TraR/DksA C4-type zinc finger protein [Paucibacter sediminis]|uniref:TraR/DksA C4-type zinc finger protein n=1 Tax=Paucibacter sediminis TaxID=3019553 RepID=A0AA95ND87_9BURK|nr:TraR/DksA C4-type zinc finger protein [Paucibacter sp. S2-9]WIT13050.1 TraR/DksA C4-type zinc finger protein [Paucibacter sp. S2-9]
MTQDLTPGQHAQLEMLLVQRQQELERSLHGQLGEQSRAEHARELLLQDGDDEPARDADREVDLARSDRHLDELRQVNEALQRLRGQGYGLCSDCGEAIAFDRLQRQPEALRCLDCQRRLERAQGDPSAHHRI